MLYQTNALIRKTKDEKASVEEQIQKLNGNPGDAAQINYLKAKQARLNAQLNRLYNQRFELRRQNLFTSMALASVGVLLTSAVLTLVFPPLAPLVATAGMLFFASTIISNVLTSPSVRQKITQFIDWVMGAEESDDAPGPGPGSDLGATKAHGNSYTVVMDQQASAVAPPTAALPSASREPPTNTSYRIPTGIGTGTAKVSDFSKFAPASTAAQMPGSAVGNQFVP